MVRTIKFSALALLGVMVLWSCGKPLGPKESGEKFLKAIKTHDYTTAKNYATEDMHAGLDLIKGINIDKEPGNPDQIRVGDVEVDGDNAVLKYLDEGKENSLKLIKIEGHWKAHVTKELPKKDVTEGLEEALDESSK